MNFRTTSTRLAAAFVGSAMAGVLAFGASPASASASAGYVNGAGTYGDDWRDEGTLSSSAYTKSNATCLWQKILVAEGVDRAAGSPVDFADSDVDGIFGKRTAYASAKLQKRWGLPTDSKIGPKTWTKASTKLKYVSGSTSPGKILQLVYVGEKSKFPLTRDTKGHYTFSQDGGTHVAAYKSRSCK